MSKGGRASASRVANASADLWAQAGPTPSPNAMLTPTTVPTGAGGAALNQQVRRAPLTDPFDSVPNVLANRRDPRVSDRKRTWAGSPTLEQSQRGGTKRPCTRPALPYEREALPPVAEELGGNPWLDDLSQIGLGKGQIDDEDDEYYELQNPVATSTPAFPPTVHTDSVSMMTDDTFLANLNTSGRPPTPHNLNLSLSRDSSVQDSANIQETAERTKQPTRRRTYATSIAESNEEPSYSEPPSTRWNQARDSQQRNRMSLNEILTTPNPTQARGTGATAPRTRVAADPRTTDPRTRGSVAHVYGGGETHRNALPATRRDTPYPPRTQTQRSALPARSQSGYLPPPRTRAADYVRSMHHHTSPPNDQARSGRSTPMDVDDAIDDILTQVGDQHLEQTAAGTEHRVERASPVSPTPARRSLQEPTREDRTPATGSRRSPSWDEGPALRQDRDQEDGLQGARGPAPSWWDRDAETEDEEAEDEIDGLPTCLTQDPADGGERPMPTPAHLRIPLVHKDDPEMLLRGVSSNWIRAMWTKTLAKKAIPVYVYNYRYTDSVAYNRLVAKALRHAAATITGNHEVRAVPPEPEHEDDVRGDEALLWALRDLTEDDAEVLLSRPVWSFAGITFFPVSKEVGPDRWVFSLEGFLDDDAAAIRDAVQRVLLEDENAEIIERLTRRNPDLRDMSSALRVRAIVSSVNVTTWTTSGDNVIANVFIRPPTRVTRLWRAWVARLRTRRYGNYVNGTGVVRWLSHCLGCRSTDHPTHLCPFPDLPGWNGPDAGSGSFTRSLPPPPPPRRDRRQPERPKTQRQRSGGMPSRTSSTREPRTLNPKTPAKRENTRAHRGVRR